jgi:hypothetical protein
MIECKKNTIEINPKCAGNCKLDRDSRLASCFVDLAPLGFDKINKKIIVNHLIHL